MLHSTTSPLYAIAASNDIAASMMDHGGGKTLTDESIREAVAFRQALMRTYRELTGRGSWFFHPWNPWEVYDPTEVRRSQLARDRYGGDDEAKMREKRRAGDNDNDDDDDDDDDDNGKGAMVKFDHAKPDLLASDSNCWLLEPGAGGKTWHGFEGLEEGWCMLDPIKVGTPLPTIWMMMMMMMMIDHIAMLHSQLHDRNASP